MPITQATRNFTKNSIRLQDTGAGTVQTTQARIVVSRIVPASRLRKQGGQAEVSGTKANGREACTFPVFRQLVRRVGSVFFFAFSFGSGTV
jgi:hypothetical protein